MKLPSIMRGSGRFAKTPSVSMPRSQFDRSHGHKTTLDAGLLIPVYWDEVLPGDTFNLKMTAFCRMSTPVKPLMDNLYLDSFFFFVPNRLLWDNWAKFCGEQEDPGDSIAYTVPQYNVTAAGFNAGTLPDYLGVPIGVTSSTTSWTHSALPIRAYYRIWNAWFRDENLQDSVNAVGTSGASFAAGNGPDTGAAGGCAVLRRGKRHDYFTSCLPWVQKFTGQTFGAVGGDGDLVWEGASSGKYGALEAKAATDPTDVQWNLDAAPTATENLQYRSGLEITSNTINDLREAIYTQRMLERDARGGTRYAEIIMSHFRVHDPMHAVLQRPEYLGGGTAPVIINPIAQTAATDTGTSSQTEQGNLAGIGTAVATGHGFVKSFTEHGIVMGLVSVRADLNYQEGLERGMSRSTRYDFYWPDLANLGEQAVLNKEICLVDASTDDDAFGYQERWAEYRYKPSRITGEFRSNHGSTLEVWHLAQDYAGSCPSLDATWIVENPDMARVLASSSNDHFLFDSFFRLICARPMPMHSIPGMGARL